MKDVTQLCKTHWNRIGAAGPTRTDDLTLTKRLLYQLSYSGGEEYCEARILTRLSRYKAVCLSVVSTVVRTHSGGNRLESVGTQAFGKVALDMAHEIRAMKYQRRIQLHQ